MAAYAAPLAPQVYLSKIISARDAAHDNQPVTALHLCPIQCRVCLAQVDLWRLPDAAPSMVIAPMLIETESPCRFRRMSRKLLSAAIALHGAKAFRPAVAQDDEKFFATIPSHRIPRSHGAGSWAQPPARPYLRQVSVYVVNPLEMVDVTEQQRNFGVLPLRTMNFAASGELKLRLGSIARLEHRESL